MEEKLEQAMDAASRNVAKCLPVQSGGGGAENAYAQAYQALVRAGLRPQLRKKYRA